MPKSLKFLWGLLTAALLGMGGSLLFLFLQPYPSARALLDPLSKDGSLELFSLPFYTAARLPILAFGAVLCGLALAGVIWQLAALRLLQAALRFPGRFATRFQTDARLFARSLSGYRFSRREVFWLVGLLLLAVLARAPFLMRALEHDEAYTVVAFAAAPLNMVVTDYHHPNNHVFHTLFVHFALKLFGYQPWGVRLPAFLASLLVIPAVYVFAAIRYDRRVGILAGAACAVLPVLIYFSTNARGYTMIMLFTLLIFILAEYVRRHPNLLGWMLLVLLSSLGFYTVPIFLYPFGVTMTWLFFSWLIGDIGKDYASRWSFFRCLFFAGLATVALTVLLYTPIFFYSGIRSVFSEGVTNAIPWDVFFAVARGRVWELYQQWMEGLPPGTDLFFLAGILLSLIVPGKNLAGKAGRVSWLLAAVVWIVGLVILQRSNPWARFYAFLIPLVCIWAAAGWVKLLAWLTARFAPRLNLVNGFAMAVLVLALVGTGMRVTSHPNAGFDLRGDIPAVAQFFKQNLREQDLIVVAPLHDAELWYYSRLFGLDMDHYRRELPFFRMFVVVDPSYRETLESVLVERGPERFFYDMNEARLVYQAEHVQVYECIPFADLIRKEYRLP